MRILLFIALTASTLAAQISIGQGSPNDTIRSAIQRGFYRGIFPQLAGLPPNGTVRALAGASGAYVQEFPDITKVSGLTLAIIATPGINVGGEVLDNFQLLHPMYAFYTSSEVGAANAGLPLGDTESFNLLAADNFTSLNKYQYQLFSRNWALFVWNLAPENGNVGREFILKDPFYSRWKNLGNFAYLGPCTSSETALTSTRSTAATVVKFANGYLFNMTSGPSAGRVVVVGPSVYQLYFDNGGPTGRLGFPINDEINIAIGNQSGKRQQFEGGTIEYVPGQPAVLKNAVSSIQLSTTGSIRLNLNDTFSLRASLTTAAGETVNDRDVSWTTSNARVVAVQTTLGNTIQVTLRAAGGGSAVVTATSEGRTSLPLTVFVSAPCCQVGEGAPTTGISQTFLDAVSRNRLTVRLPTPNPVRRAGAGYVQEVTLTDNRRILLTKSDSLSQAFIVSNLLETYESAGGPTGPLGYPVADPTTTGRQLFENQNALAGDPPFVVNGTILARWAQLGYDNPDSALGQPISPAAGFLTFTTVSGRGQLFRNGAIYTAETGLLVNRAFYVRGVIAAKYAELGGPTGLAGLPTSDEFQVSGRFRQEFEGATLEYGPGEREAQVTEKTRRPVASASPQTVVAGNRLRLAVGGFAPNSTLQISVAGQPDFRIDSASGSYAWDSFVPANARTSSVLVRALRVGSTPAVTAETTYNIRALAETVFDLRRISGDTQTGAPGALLPAPIGIRLRDEFGTPIVNYPVRFNASAGAAIVAPGGNTITTNDQGEAEVQVRMPATEGVALATAEAGRSVTTFSFRVAASTLTNFPRQAQSPGIFAEQTLGPGPGTVGAKGSLAAAISSVLRYYQSRGELPQPNGLVDPGLLNQYLKDFCAIDQANRRICDGFLTGYGSGADPILNPFRAPAFVGGNADAVIEAATPVNIRDLVAAGTPVIVALSLDASGNPAGAHFVAAIGITGAGDIEIHDPNPGLNRRTLEAYLNGDGGLTGKITGAFRYALRSPGAGAFYVAANASARVVSNAGACGPAFSFPEGLAVSPVTMTPSSTIHFAACDGARQPLELQFTSDRAVRASFVDLGNPALQLDLTAPESAIYRASQTNGQWLVNAQSATFEASAVLSAASFTPNLAPGGLFSIFGAGLAREGTPTLVEVDGTPATVVFQSAFQVNARMPVDARPGPVTIRVRSPFGQTDRQVTVKALAPAIFLLGPKTGAIVNQNGTLNAPLTPATRGQAVVAYGTGFGATVLRGNLQATVAAVTSTINGQSAQVLFAGLTPGFIGLYQVNVLIPAALPPGNGLPFVLQQGDETVSGLELAVQ